MSFSLHKVIRVGDIPEALINGDLRHAPGVIKGVIELAVARRHVDSVVQIVASGHLPTVDYSTSDSDSNVSLTVSTYHSPTDTVGGVSVQKK